MASRLVKYACALGLVVGFALVATGGDPSGAGFGDPLPGLTVGERQHFLAGKEAFEEVEGEADGLGPVFTEDSCAKCHASPAVGGGSEIVETRIGRLVGGRFDPLIEFGGPLIQNRGIGSGDGPNGPYHYDGEVVPPQATIQAGRRSTPLFGLGLVEAVPDGAFLELAEFQRRTSPRTAGRPHLVRNLATGQPAVGRFGWKAQIATLFDFSGDAYTNEMGITTPLVPLENCPQGDCDSLASNPFVGSPNEEDNEDLDLFSAFMRGLAPPPRGAVTAEARAGAAVFTEIGCAACHVPTLRTGPHPVGALDRVSFHPFSDFLLHDMGSLGDEIEQGDAQGREMRTAPLWGVRKLTTFLHDGRATTLEAAILAHDGQGRSAREQFAALSAKRRARLLAFLDSL